MNRRSCVVVGVAAESFLGAAPLLAPADVWVPAGSRAQLMSTLERGVDFSVMGFRPADMPAARQRSRSPVITFAVTAIIGTWRESRRLAAIRIGMQNDAGKLPGFLRQPGIGPRRWNRVRLVHQELYPYRP